MKRPKINPIIKQIMITPIISAKIDCPSSEADSANILLKNISVADKTISSAINT